MVWIKLCSILCQSLFTCICVCFALLCFFNVLPCFALTSFDSLAFSSTRLVSISFASHLVASVWFRRTNKKKAMLSHQHLMESSERTAHADDPPTAKWVALSPRSTATRLLPMSVGSSPTSAVDPIPSSPFPFTPKHCAGVSTSGTFRSLGRAGG